MFPRRMAGLNRWLTNPMLRPLALLMPPFAVIEHAGRRTGRRYRTPVFAFRRGGEMVVVLSYGRNSDWVRNLLAGGGPDPDTVAGPEPGTGPGPAAGVPGVIRLGRRSGLRNPRVVPVASCGPLSPLGRFSCRFADHVLIADVVTSRAPI